MSSTIDTDVVVVGGGPGGLAAAAHAAEAGALVVFAFIGALIWLYFKPVKHDDERVFPVSDPGQVIGCHGKDGEQFRRLFLVTQLFHQRRR